MYIYVADVWCDSCGDDIRRRITQDGKAPPSPNDEYTYDSDDFPKGPYPETESVDNPSHCAAEDTCFNAITLPYGAKIGALLNNPLSESGVEYVKSQAELAQISNLWLQTFADQL